MSNEVKQRKKGASSKELRSSPGCSQTSGHQLQQDELKGKVKAGPLVEAGRGSLCPEPRTVLCLLCLAICASLSWLVFQQSQKFAVMEEKYQILEKKSEVVSELEGQVNAMFGKLVSTEDILAEASSSSSVVSHLQLQMAALQREVDDIQNNDVSLSAKMQNINARFQNVTDTWRKSLDEITLDTGMLKSKAKSLHSQINTKINSAEQSLKLLKERMGDLEDSTLRNTRTVKNQEENEFVRVEETLDWNTKAIESLEKEQSDLTDVHLEVQQNLAELKPKVEECINNLPTIEKAIRTLLKVSNEMVELDKKTNDLTVQVFNTEDNLLKTISEILEIQNTLERIQIDNSILKMQNDIGHLKEKAYIEPSDPDHTLLIEEEKETEPANKQT
ncbi:IKBKB interacting protein S homeolog isoform X1 [Xenopus laevis]|uniref:IKBKB interacting protein S homeolog isoform X1 n=2 Tax=Xenopus laevis TaxID=8355 RepID=A0A1L8GQW0_XENLA|nr:IKBKB interacting protein S homeolog isoform X1 [Xenopus laevis]XP_018109878.1 IKBKB interacting protein S homeolog isoform X1 [Xenopus laevis]OCT86212.1 hypothetical protein XELAEV_18019904mg [Xenopus laevis]